MSSAFDAAWTAKLGALHAAFGQGIEIRPMRRVGQNAAATADDSRAVTTTTGIFETSPRVFAAADAHDSRADTRLGRSAFDVSCRVRRAAVPYAVRVMDIIVRVSDAKRFTVMAVEDDGPGHMVLALAGAKD